MTAAKPMTLGCLESAALVEPATGASVDETVGPELVPTGPTSLLLVAEPVLVPDGAEVTVASVEDSPVTGPTSLEEVAEAG